MYGWRRIESAGPRDFVRALQLLWQFIRESGRDIHSCFINLESGRVTPLPINGPDCQPACAQNFHDDDGDGACEVEV